ncbi:MAG: class B sortase [Christensenellaceae bacterium]|jgi:SrtB family sortase|nr:class B sortase [Christensenellaceae bacterium]
MRKRFKRILGIMLVLMMCLSLLPVVALAEGSSDAGVIGQTEEIPNEIPSEPTDDSSSVPDDSGPVESQPPPAESTPTPVPEESKPDETTPEPDTGEPAEPTPAPTTPITPVQPELVKVVDKPLVRVDYHYFSDSPEQVIVEYAAYTVSSTHSYYAIALANGESITIAANKFPGILPVSTAAPRFRVLLNDSEDITALASYDAQTGLVTLPQDYMGHAITIEWYCPASEAVELLITATVCVFENGRFVTTTTDLRLPSNTGSISVPLAGADGLVVSQNGIELPADAYSFSDGTVHVSTSPLGGDVTVVAYTNALRLARNNGGQVAHTRGEDQIYYGYYTHYFTANGNTAFCLQPSVPSAPSGTYPVSRYLQPGVDDALIKCAYYLYGGPGYDSVKHNLFESPDSLEAYGLSHAVAAYAYSGSTSQAFYGLSSSLINHLLAVYSSVCSQPMPPDGFEVFVYNEADGSTQSFVGWNYNPTGDLEIQKVSSNPAMSNGNSCYSLAGAVFDVYDGGNSKVGTITTDANGWGRLEGLPAGSGYYLVEVSPPKGFALNTSRISFTIVSGQTMTVQVSNLPQNDPVGILLRKQDSETSAAVPQGGATLAGAEFTVKYYKGLYSAGQLSGMTPDRTWVLRTDTNGVAFLHPDYLVSGDAFYYAGNSDPTLPLGTVTIQETKPPTGYLINNELFVRQITSQGTAESIRTYNAPIVPDQVIRGGVAIEKWDFDLNRRAAPQGDATLAGSVLEIYNRSANSVVVNGKTYAPGAVVHTLTTDENGAASTPNDLLPYGEYEIIEKTPPTGYLNTGVIRQTFAVRDQGIIVSLKTSATTIKNNVIRGGVEIEKWDIERDERVLRQGDATLEGAVLEIWNRSAHSVVVEGVEYAPGAVVYTLTTDADGWAGTESGLLPYGSYEIIEKTPPTGYLNTGIIRQSFQIREEGVIVNLKASESVIKNNIIRGGVLVEKWDNEIDAHRPQGGATLEGAIFEIVNRSADSVLVQDVLYDVGEVVYTFETDSTGTAQTPSELLPYGTYEVREISPPTGYLATGVLNRTFVIREHGVTVVLNTSDTAIKNNPIRGDLKGVKISDGDAKRLANVPFLITSATTGESHVIVTDINGEFNTASSWNPHSQNTNRGETDRDGIWFGQLETLNDDLGALLYDTYIIEELPCEANKDYELLIFEVSIYRHNTVVDLGTLTNDYIVVPEIFTTARDQDTGTGNAYVSEKTTIIDTVYYSGLKAGQEYTVRGVLMNKETGEPLLVDGEQVTAEATFRALSDTGSVSMPFTFDSSAMKGKAVVVFETLYFEDEEVATHADIEDEGQTVTFMDPKIGTSAADPDGEKVLGIRTEVTLVDTVSYENLIPGKEYTLKGVLMDKGTGAPLLVDGAQVVAETTFTPDEANGTVEVVFTFNSTALKGKTVVVFETLEAGGIEIATHADIEDEGQTVTFTEPKIGTSAKAEDGGKTIPIAASVTVVDVVSYENLVPGEKYVIKGVLMDKQSGQPLMKDGKAITAETTFTPTAASGTVEVRFTFDTRAIAGRTLVVFETLECDGQVIAEHKDINDEAQAVSVKEYVPEPPEPAPTPEPGKPVPQTSDDYSIVLWLALAAIALPGLLVSAVLLCKKKRKALVVLIFCGALLAASAYMAFGEWKQYSEGAGVYTDLAQYVTPPSEPTPDAEEPTSAPDETTGEEAGSPASSLSLPSVDYAALRDINPDIVGWLILEDTNINFPIAQGSDNSRYLNHLYDGARGKAGTPFLDYESSPDFTDGNSIVYGHNLLDGSMFSCLTEYAEQAYYDAHPAMLLLTPDGAYRMEIFATFVASPDEAGADTSPWRQAWDTEEDFSAWLSQAQDRSVIQAGVELSPEDTVLTLSTCTNRGRDRFLVMGRLVPAT